MKIEKIITYKTDNKIFDNAEKAENYLLDKVQTDLHELLNKEVFNLNNTMSSLSYYTVLSLVGDKKNLKRLQKILDTFEEFPEDSTEEDEE